MPAKTARDRIALPPIVSFCASPRHAMLRQRNRAQPGASDISLHVLRITN